MDTKTMTGASFSLPEKDREKPNPVVHLGMGPCLRRQQQLPGDSTESCGLIVNYVCSDLAAQINGMSLFALAG
jgi:hypothetical protein